MKITLEESYTVPEVAKRLECWPRSVYRYIKEGKLKAHKVGGRWQVWEKDLTSFLNGETSKQPPKQIVVSHNTAKAWQSITSQYFTASNKHEEEQAADDLAQAIASWLELSGFTVAN